MEEFISNSAEETLEIASNFAKTLSRGDIVLLDGDLGAGKTVFVKGVANAFSGGNVIAVSPTFVIVNVYNTDPEIYHFDLYRINDVSELDAIGAEEYFYSNGISIVEWPERADGMFPASAIKVNINKVTDNERVIVVER
jgi:tRNA threonylcarbamoyladenosine biosynthesis protein TsaE